MRAMKCDRCGKFYEFYKGSDVFDDIWRANGVMLIDMDLERIEKKFWINRKTYDLCPDCMKELENFLNKERNKKEESNNASNEM